MFKKLEAFSDRLLSRVVPATTASASCPCGSYPYTGPCHYYIPCGAGRTKYCYCERSAAYIWCASCSL